MQSILQEYFDSLKGKRVAVIGMGVSNTPLIRRMLQGGVQVLVCDRREREAFGGLVEELEEAGGQFCLGPDYLKAVTDADVIFRTPGLRPDVPELTQAAANGAQLTSEMEVFMQLCPCRVLGVTGSDGKTTTTTIIAGLLKAEGYRTFVGGNIGNPLLCQVDEMRPDDLVVLELSSFQLLTMQQSPSVAVVTNVSPNHVDVHVDMEEYVQAKSNIFAHQDDRDTLVLNGDDELTAQFAAQAKGRVVLFSRTKLLEQGVCVREGWIMLRSRPVLAVEDILLPGVHNLENYMAAIAAVDGLVSDQTIQQFARTFSGVAHRIELVRELDGVKWYNDSIASSPSRTIAGLRAFNQKVILIAGGYDKHTPYDVLGPQILQSVKVLLLTGDTAEKIQQAVEQAPGYAPGHPEIIRCEHLRQAVEQASRKAEAGDVVILSPASASFDQFRNFEERGNVFRQYVNEL